MINHTKKGLFTILFLLLSCGACGSQKVELNCKQVAKTVILGGFGTTLKENDLADKTISDKKEKSEMVVQNKTDTVDRHAFTLGNELIFTADIPKNWRYVFYPVYDYAYLRNLPESGDNRNRHHIDFIGTGAEDGEDNFFIITVSEGKGAFEGEFSLELTEEEKLSSAASSPFKFRDGTPGTWKYHVWEGSLYRGMSDTKAAYYEGIVQPDGEKYNIHLFMLKEEYDVNEAVIMDFLASLCFGESNVGVYDNKGLLERELLTMHIWDEYLNMSLQIPEGAALVKNDYYNDTSNKVRSYKVYLDRDRHTYFEIISNQGGGIMERTGDSRYYLNTKDFKETVYELTGYNGGYYFPNWHLWVKNNISDKNVELLEYVKGIMRSFRFE